MMDFTRVRIFIKKNKLDGEQIDELYDILKDFQDNCYQNCFDIIGVKRD